MLLVRLQLEILALVIQVYIVERHTRKNREYKIHLLFFSTEINRIKIKINYFRFDHHHSHSVLSLY